MEPSLAEVTISLDEATFRALLDGSLQPLKAFATRRLHIKGDRSKLRALEWLWADGEGMGGGAKGRGGARVTVRGESAEGGYGSYELIVSEGASCWKVRRRWSEVRLQKFPFPALHYPPLP